MEKTCVKCNSTFPATKQFWYKQKNGKHGLRSKCKKCSSEEMKEYRDNPEFKERHRLKMIEWRKNNPDRVNEINKKSRDKRRVEYNKNKREKYRSDENFRLKRIEYDRKYYYSGKRLVQNSKTENREKARNRSRKRRMDESKKQQDLDRSRIWREQNIEYLRKLWKSCREELKPSYIAQSMRMPVGQITNDVIETKRIIIQLKRELKKNNVKIK